jgi:hypothetical protein
MRSIIAAIHLQINGRKTKKTNTYIPPNTKTMVLHLTIIIPLIDEVTEMGVKYIKLSKQLHIQILL